MNLVNCDDTRGTEPYGTRPESDEARGAGGILELTRRFKSLRVPGERPG
jgi:hypothetical protein